MPRSPIIGAQKLKKTTNAAAVKGVKNSSKKSDTYSVTCSPFTKMERDYNVNRNGDLHQRRLSNDRLSVQIYNGTQR